MLILVKIWICLLVMYLCYAVGKSVGWSDGFEDGYRHPKKRR